MPDSKPPKQVPEIIEWVDQLPAPPPPGSVWDEFAESIRKAPTTDWAVMERFEPWQSSWPTWFRKRYKDLELNVPPITKNHKGPKLMYVRRKPLAPSPVDRR